METHLGKFGNNQKVFYIYINFNKVSMKYQNYKKNILLTAWNDSCRLSYEIIR